MTDAIRPRPQTFEQLGAEDGLVAYEAAVSYPAGALLTVDGLHDRAKVDFLGDERIGVLDRDGTASLPLPWASAAALLTIVVESLGRINYGLYTGEGKGIHARRDNRPPPRARLGAPGRVAGAADRAR